MAARAVDSTSDEDALDAQRVLQGDVTAFEGIVRRWQGPLVNLAFRFCRDRGRAEEMAQEAFLKIYHALAGYRADAAFSTWLFAVALNSFRSGLRRSPPSSVPLDAVAGLADPKAAHGHLALELLDERDRGDAVRRAVSSLPARYRDAIVLYYFFEMDVEAAARTLSLPGGTVKARLHRGRELLRRKLAGTFPASPAARPDEVSS